MSRGDIYRLIFSVAGLYNIAFGLWAALAPHAFFRLLDLGAPSHPAIWACLGMVVGLYGAIYLQVAFSDAAHTRSVVAIGRARVEYDFTRFLIALGLAGKILGPVGFAIGVRNLDVSPRLFSLLVLNDFIWWPAFGLYLIDDTAIADWLRRHAPQICAVAHLAAGIATWCWIRGGSEAVSDPIARVEFIAVHVTTWRAGWVVWMVAAATLIGFLCWWAARAEKKRLALAALCLAFGGIAADYFADALFIAWMPDRYAQIASLTTFVSEVIANGLYSLAGAVLLLATPRLPAAIRFWGWGVWLSGFALATFGVLRWNWAIVASSAVLLMLFVPWVWVAGRAIEERA